MELKDAQVLVVKVGTSTLTYENGKVNLRRLERLCRTLSDLQNAGRKPVSYTHLIHLINLLLLAGLWRIK